MESKLHKESGDAYISTTDLALSGPAETDVIGAFLVDIFPLLRFVPSWVPGACFQKKATQWKTASHNYNRKIFPICERTIGKGSFPRQSRSCGLI